MNGSVELEDGERQACISFKESHDGTALSGYLEAWNRAMQTYWLQRKLNDRGPTIPEIEQSLKRIFNIKE